MEGARDPGRVGRRTGQTHTGVQLRIWTRGVADSGSQMRMGLRAQGSMDEILSVGILHDLGIWRRMLMRRSTSRLPRGWPGSGRGVRRGGSYSNTNAGTTLVLGERLCTQDAGVGDALQGS